MEETLGERINLNRTTEAVETGADQIATGCPFCRVMLSDGLTAKQADGSAREEVEVLDVAQLLLASVKRAPAPKPASGDGTPSAAASAGAGTATAVLEKPTEEPPQPDAVKAEPDAGDATQTEQTVTEPGDVGAGAAASTDPTPVTPEHPAEETEPADATLPDPASTDEPEASTEPADDAAVHTQHEAATGNDAEPDHEKRDDTLF
jgi:hypothetical protein